MELLFPVNENSSGGYTAPGAEDFEFHSLFGTSFINKPMLQLTIAAVLVLGYGIFSARRMKVVPTKGQFIFEQIYDYIRNGVGRDVIGADYRKWSPYLVGLFLFILLNNWFGEFFVFMFPAFSNIGYVYGMALVTMVLFIYCGFRGHGWRYVYKSITPSGVPLYLAVIIAPVEFLSNFVTRPLTLAVRLFANMFAGHLSLLVFIVGGGFLLTYQNNLLYNLSGAVALVASLVLACLELFIGYLQAYIFTVLTAQYIATAGSSDH